MKYRQLGSRVNEQISALGVGCMRLPTLGEPGKIDTPAAKRMLHTAIEAGVNYIDTAWPYHNQASEPFVGEVLSEGLRNDVLLATKMPMWAVKEPADLDSFLSKQLERLKTDHIDFYLLHALGRSLWDTAKRVDAIAWGERQRELGKIRYFGFSFHDELPVFKEIIDAHAWDFCQIQYNYMNERDQAGTAGLRYAADRGIGVVVMEPLLGGTLARQPPEVARIWEQASVSRSGVEWALQWLWSKPEVGTVLSGMSELEHVQRNVEYAGRSEIGLFGPDDQATIDQTRRAYEGRQPVPCTQCKYCMPCQNGVDIPRNFDVYNTAAMFDTWREGRHRYSRAIPESARASECIACGECLEKCPQHIPIIDALAEVHEKLTTPGD